MEEIMNEYRCDSCGFVYDPEQKINSGVFFKDIPDTYVCPACKGGKSNFKKLGKSYYSGKEKFNKLKNEYIANNN